MKKNKILFGIAALVIGIVIVGIFVKLGGEKSPVVIGGIISISGPAPVGPTAEGKGVRNGMLLAVEEVNAFGGINGSKIELAIEDATVNPGLGKELLEKIEAEHHPLFYISTHSSVSAAVAPLAEEKGAVLVATLAADPKITQQKEWVFRYWPTAEIDAPTAMSSIQKAGVLDLGILYLDDEFGRSYLEVVQREMGKIGGVASGVSFGARETDFREEIRQLKNTDGIFAVGFPTHLKTVFKQLKEEGFGGPIFSQLAAADPAFQSLPEADGLHITAPIIYNPTFLFAQEFKEKYETRFGEPFTYFAATGYDIIKMLAALLEDEELSRENVKKLLEAGFTHPGVLGTITVRPGNHDMAFPTYPAQIKGGTVRYQY